MAVVLANYGGILAQDVAIEDNRVEVRHHGRAIATTRLSPIEVPAWARPAVP